VEIVLNSAAVPLPQIDAVLRPRALKLPRDELEKEMTDPLDFVVGAVLTALFDWSFQAYVRLINAAWVLAIVVAPALAIAWSDKLGIGDPVSYGLTLLGASALPLIPSRIAELKRQGKCGGGGYPWALRTAMDFLEVWVVVAAAVLIFAWHFGDHNGHHHTVERAVSWALGAVALGDLFTVSACRAVTAVSLGATTLSLGGKIGSLEVRVGAFQLGAKQETPPAPTALALAEEVEAEENGHTEVAAPTPPTTETPQPQAKQPQAKQPQAKQPQARQPQAEAAGGARRRRRQPRNSAGK
jgi:hypothetical protein